MEATVSPNERRRKQKFGDALFGGNAKLKLCVTSVRLLDVRVFPQLANDFRYVRRQFARRVELLDALRQLLYRPVEFVLERAARVDERLNDDQYVVVNDVAKRTSLGVREAAEMQQLARRRFAEH